MSGYQNLWNPRPSAFDVRSFDTYKSPHVQYPPAGGLHTHYGPRIGYRLADYHSPDVRNPRVNPQLYQAPRTVASIYPYRLTELAEAGGPLVVATWSNQDFQAAAQTSWDHLIATSGQNRLEALVAGLSECEKRQCDTTVGYGGSPDENGDVALDALLIDGPQQRMGAVGSLRRVRDAARVAWAVMNYTKHSFLVGEDATKFALAMGFEEQSLETEKSKKMHEDWLAKKCQPNFWKNVEPNPREACGPYKPLSPAPTYAFHAGNEVNNDISSSNHDTIGIVVIDGDANVSAGTSTNGARNKVPGRVGDSPIPGAGAFVDNDVGGAVGTGDGDVMMRFGPALVAVEAMHRGSSPQKAAEIAITRIKRFYPDFSGAIVAAHKNGTHGAACSGMPTFGYSVVGPTDWTTARSEKVRVVTVTCL
ncbi:Protein R04B3.2 [Aphelenchoides avenae]|nr:Protein R04B3.2 [Aphelenchus avenae]